MYTRCSNGLLSGGEQQDEDRTMGCMHRQRASGSSKAIRNPSTRDDASGGKALLNAALGGHWNLVKMLADAGADFNATCSKVSLHIACIAIYIYIYIYIIYIYIYIYIRGCVLQAC